MIVKLKFKGRTFIKECLYNTININLLLIIRKVCGVTILQECVLYLGGTYNIFFFFPK